MRLDDILRVTREQAKELRVQARQEQERSARAMKHFGLYERDNKQKPFYVPPVINVIGVPGRGQGGTIVEGERLPVRAIGVPAKPEV